MASSSRWTLKPVKRRGLPVCKSRMEDEMAWEGMARRQFPRVIYPCMVKVTSSHGSQEPILAHTENIGLGGLCVTLKNEIKLFTPVDMEIDLLDIEEHIKLKGRVVWN